MVKFKSRSLKERDAHLSCDFEVAGKEGNKRDD